MSRTERKEPRRWYNHEGRWARILIRRTERAKARHLMNTGRFDLADTRQVKGTEGWITW